MQKNDSNDSDTLNNSILLCWIFSRRLQCNCPKSLTWSVQGDWVHLKESDSAATDSHKYLGPHIHCIGYFPSYPNRQHSWTSAHFDCFASNQRDLLKVLLKLNSAVASLMRLAFDLVSTSGPAGWLHIQEIMPNTLSSSVKLATYSHKQWDSVKHTVIYSRQMQGVLWRKPEG